ncbi:MAG: VanZ family protein [Anaerolineae bacterium]
MTSRRFWWIVALLVAAWLLWMTLRGSGAVNRDLTPLIESQAGRMFGAHLLISILGNVAVFVPLGAAVALAPADQSLARRIGWATIVGAGLSAIIEVLQMALPSRRSDPLDWVLNTVGAGIGAVGVVLLKKYLTEFTMRCNAPAMPRSCWLTTHAGVHERAVFKRPKGRRTWLKT